MSHSVLCSATKGLRLSPYYFGGLRVEAPLFLGARNRIISHIFREVSIYSGDLYLLNAGDTISSLIFRNGVYFGAN